MAVFSAETAIIMEMVDAVFENVPPLCADFVLSVHVAFLRVLFALFADLAVLHFAAVLAVLVFAVAQLIFRVVAAVLQFADVFVLVASIAFVVAHMRNLVVV